MRELVRLSGADERARVIERADGTIRIEYIMPEDAAPYADLVTLHERDGGPWSLIEVGDEGVLMICERLQRGHEQANRAYLLNEPDGAPGNTDHTVRRLHGWRGTTNDLVCDAHGWRRVESIEPRKRGHGFVAILSADLRPDED